ncbi:MAG: HEPN domain-containing protein [Boseongicola sp.]|nr:HEPN domain-containing protein [Boseongicola sp.]
MSTSFSVIVEEFVDSLGALEEVVKGGQGRTSSAPARVAAIRAATLLLAATFEEFVREMALEHAVQVVGRASSVSALPDALLDTAWRRTFDRFSRRQKAGRSIRETLETSAKQARSSVEALCKFIEGDKSQNIFDNLIHNENNMRVRQINILFRVGGLSDICTETCKQTELKNFFDTEDDDKTHGELLGALDGFFDRRNQIAHSLRAASSSAPEALFRDIEFFLAFSLDLCTTLEAWDS